MEFFAMYEESYGWKLHNYHKNMAGGWEIHQKLLVMFDINWFSPHVTWLKEMFHNAMTVLKEQIL